MRCAVLGTGSISCRHLSNLMALGHETPTAISRHSRRSSLSIDEQKIDVTHDYEAALSDPTVEAVFIGSPTSHHLKDAQQALTAGKHVYLEKPAHTESSGVEKLALLAHEKSRTIAVGHQLRFNRPLIRLREELLKGTIGRVLAVQANLGEHVSDFHSGEDYRQSYTCRPELGGGVLLSQIHQINYLNWLFGPFDKALAFSPIETGLDLPVEDIVTFTLIRDGKGPIQAHTDYLQRPKSMYINVIGATGSLSWNYHNDTVTLISDNGPMLLASGPNERNVMFLDAMQDFFGSIETNRTPQCSLTDALSDLLVVDAVKRSLASGCPETIDALPESIA